MIVDFRVGEMMQSGEGRVPFIDGLRAVSIISVVAYHVGVPGFASGFVGVDIFFVISGYLIIGQIRKSISEGTFSFGEFWARRVRRILPVYVVVMLASFVLANFVLVLPDEIQDFSRSLVASLFMVSNHYFFEQQGYFDTEATLKPLLHTWSLSVRNNSISLRRLPSSAPMRWPRGAA